MSFIIWINGIVSEKIAVQDRGLHYGDGVWETIAIQQGQAEFLHEHLQRLFFGCQQLGIELPKSIQLREEIKIALQAIEQTQGILKIIITRGQGGRGYNPIGASQPCRILSTHPWPDDQKKFYKHGINLTLCKTRLAYSPKLAGFKHLNRLEQVLARAEWQAQFQEGLMMDYQDHIVEGVMTNVFIIKNETIITPPLEYCGIAGIMRAELMRLAEEDGISVKVSQLNIDDIYQADGLFLSNSILGLWPVKQFLDKSYPIPIITRQLQDRLIEFRPTMRR